MKIEDFDKQVSDISNSSDADVYISPDFQCDQAEGFPVSLCVCWNRRQAWLELVENLVVDRDKTELDYYRQCCADFGIRNCRNENEFNLLLCQLGEDAVGNAWLRVELDME